MEKKHRSKEEDMEMIRDAHTSRFHWGEIGTLRNFAVGEWQIARVYSILGMSESALYHAKRSLALAKTGRDSFEDFHLPSAYEGMARAYASAGDTRMAQRYLASAKRLAVKIKNPEDRRLILEQVGSIPIGKRTSRRKRK
jgi:hypothetical protein